jgi:hypothetical protein
MNLRDKVMDYRTSVLGYNKERKNTGKSSKYQKFNQNKGENEEKQLENVLNYGGKHEYNYLHDGKKRKVSISVDNGQRMNKNLPKYKFHIRNALGFRVYLKASTRKIAQETVNSIFGKGMYVVSASEI